MATARSPIPRRASAAAPLTTDVTVRDTEEADAWYPRMPRSAVPYQKTRGVTRTYEPPQTRIREEEPAQGFSFRRFLFVVLVVMLIGMLIALLFNTVILPAVRNWQDNANYGFPRITKATANVGHGDKAHPLSQFIGINNDGVIDVIELSYGNASEATAQVYYILTLTGQNADLVPITTITFQDVNGDGKPDMEVAINNTLYVLYNTGKTFKPAP